MTWASAASVAYVSVASKCELLGAWRRLDMTASVQGGLIGVCWGRGVAGSRGRGVAGSRGRGVAGSRGRGVAG